MTCLLCREVLLAVPGHNAQSRPEADAGGSLGPDHEGHGNRSQASTIFSPFSF